MSGFVAPRWLYGFDGTGRAPVRTSADTPGDARPFTLAYAATQRVLLMRMGPRFSDDIYRDGYAVLARFVAAHGRCSLILDLTRVTKFDLSYPFLVEIADAKPAIPGPMSRYVVAPQPHVFGAVRIVETLRAATQAPITIVRHIEEACAALGVAASDFVAA